MKMGDFPIFIITIWIKMMRYSRNICMTMGGIMKRTKLKRKVLFPPATNGSTTNLTSAGFSKTCIRKTSPTGVWA